MAYDKKEYNKRYNAANRRKKNAVKRRRDKEKIAAGICLNCTKPAEAKADGTLYRRCAECRVKEKGYQQQYKAKNPESYKAKHDKYRIKKREERMAALTQPLEQAKRLKERLADHGFHQ